MIRRRRQPHHRRYRVELVGLPPQPGQVRQLARLLVRLLGLPAAPIWAAARTWRNWSWQLRLAATSFTLAMIILWRFVL